MTRFLTLTLLSLITFSGTTIAHAQSATPQKSAFRANESRFFVATPTPLDIQEQKPKSPRPKPKPGPPDGGEEE